MKKLVQARHHAIKAQVKIPGSKSITNRALLLAALANGESTLHDILLSDDSRAFMGGLQALGIQVKLDESNLSATIQGCNGDFPNKKAEIFCKDAGTAARFLLPACASNAGQFQLDGTPRLRERPLGQLIDVLKSQGAQLAQLAETNLPLAVTGSNGLLGGTVSIATNQSSQFTSGLLMVAPFAQSTMILETNTLEKKTYIKLTTEMMAEFGVTVDSDSGTYRVALGQSYKACDYQVEPDLSTASYFFAIAALTNGEIIVENINRDNCKQGDIQFLSVLEKMGCGVEQVAGDIKIKGCENLKGIEIDMRTFSDTFMTLAALAPFADRPTTITNIAHTRLQESDRIDATATNLKRLGVKVETGDDFIRIFPGKIKPAELSSFNDHRIAMSFALIGMKVPGITIDGAECVAKTCPNYFELMDNI